MRPFQQSHALKRLLYGMEKSVFLVLKAVYIDLRTLVVTKPNQLLMSLHFKNQVSTLNKITILSRILTFPSIKTIYL